MCLLIFMLAGCCSGAQSCLTLWPHGLQHARLPWPLPSPRVCSNSCPSSRWCHPTISSSVIPFSSCPQSLPASASFPMSQLFPSGGQSVGVSASASVLPMNTQDWSPLGWTGCISFSPRGSQESLAPQFKSIISSALSLLYGPALIAIPDYWKNCSFDWRDLCWQSMSLLFSTLFRFGIVSHTPPHPTPRGKKKLSS